MANKGDNPIIISDQGTPGLGSDDGSSMRDEDTDSNSPLIGSGKLQSSSIQIPLPLSRRNQPAPCAICCTIFSIIAAVILFSVASYIGSGSIYIPVDKDPANIDMKARGQKALHMYLAAAMYGLTACVAGYYWRNPRSKLD